MKISNDMFQGEPTPPKQKKEPKKESVHPADAKEDKKKKIAIVACVIALLGVSVLGAKELFFRDRTDVPNDKVEEPDNNNNEGFGQNEEPNEQTNEEKAKDHLEKANQPVSDVTTQQARLKEGIDYLSTIGYDSFDPRNCEAFGKTTSSVASQVQAAIQLGFVADIKGSQWFYSNTEDVQQFMFTMNKSGLSGIVFYGNYLENTNEINIEYMVDQDDSLSQGILPGGGPQAHE